jgi:site-specific recombinase XerD
MDNTMSLANMAFATRQNYLRGVQHLILHYQRLPEQCSVDQLKAFLIHERDKRELSASSLNLRVCGLKYYFRHVVDRLDLVVKIPNPRLQKYNTEILIQEEIKLLRRSCRDMRQLLIISILYDTGLRVRELIRLRAGDFDKYQRTITIRNSKGNKTRVVHYGNQLRDTLNKYCKARGSVPANTLLESYKQRDHPLTLRGVQHIVQQVVKRSGIKKRVSPHTLRHTFAVHYLNRGGSLFHLQKLLGHVNITTTLHYLKYAKLPEGLTISVLDELLT